MLNIGSLLELSQRIEIPLSELQRFARSIDKHVICTPKEKSNGEIRNIYRPSKELKTLQRRINSRLLQPVYLPQTIQGSVPERSPLSNALQHVNQPYVITVDLKDFYPNIHYSRVEDLFNNLNCAESVCMLLTRLTTFQYQLAQGFPASSTIANLILKEIEPRFVNLCKQHHLRFTFYQDDLTVSGSRTAKKIFGLIVKILVQSGFYINHGKSKVQRFDEQQIVTGYIVNRAINVPNSYYQNLRQVIYYCVRYGAESQAELQTEKNVESLLYSIRGKIEWVNSVNPSRGEKLLTQFSKIPEAVKLFNFKT